MHDAVMGFIVGDCLGVPYEFTKSNSISRLEMIGYGTHNQPPGTWSDDTSFMVAALLSDQSVNGVRNNMKQVLNGEFTCDGNLFDIGGTTKSALMNPENVSKDISTNGNGSLMRILHTSLIYIEGKKDRYKYIRDISSITHPHDISVASCFIYSEVLRMALEGDFNFITNANAALDWIKSDISIPGQWINDVKLPGDVHSFDKKGYVLDSLKIILNIAESSRTYNEAMLKCINLGGDTDTHCALTGSLMALKDKVPNVLIKKVRNLHHIPI